MRSFIAFLAVPACLLGSLANPIAKQSVLAVDVMPPQVAAQLGLEEVWRRQINVPYGAQSISDQQIYVHEEQNIVYVELRETGGDASIPADAESRVLMRIPVDRLDENGLPIGKEEAERLARAENRRLVRRGIQAEIAERIVPRIDLCTVSDDGTIECRNAETGSLIWLAHVGNRRLPYGTMGINDRFLTVTNGGNLIKIGMKDGIEINTEPTSGTPLFGAIHSGDYSLVATILSGVEGYPLRDTTRDPFVEIVSGLALAPPTKAPGSSRVAWGTDRGFVYVMELSGEPSVLFRLDTDGIVSGRLASAPGNRFFFGSESGQVYAVRATREGVVLWSLPYGEPFYNAPLVVGDQVLLRSAYGNLFSLNASNGLGNWDFPVPGVDELISAFDGKVFLKTLGGTVRVLDLKTGKAVADISSLKPYRLLANQKTNRLYFVSERGTVQCLRPIGTKLPTVTDQTEPDAPEVEEPKAAMQPGMDPGAPAGGDPFGAGAPAGDPFAGGNDPFGADAGGGGDPFGGGGMNDDPFGNPAGGDAPSADDPFGGDPFGG